MSVAIIEWLLNDPNVFSSQPIKAGSAFLPSKSACLPRYPFYFSNQTAPTTSPTLSLAPSHCPPCLIPSSTDNVSLTALKPSAGQEPGECVKKMWYIHIMECYSAIEKNEIMPFGAAGMNLKIPRHTQWSKPDKDKWHMASLICGILKNKWYQWTYIQNRKRLTDI